MKIFYLEFQHTTSTDQNNVCNCCNIPFSSISNFPARRCHYYGKLYCARCHIMDYAYIPAKIIKSFDMRLYPVCRRAKSILQLSLYQPIFDIQNDNENLYTSVPLLSEIKSIRLQFQHFYAYLSTCPRIENELNENFFKEFHARDYLYQSVHLYSLDDLLSLKKVLNILNRASIQAKQHINQCVICQARGFTCEICKNRTDILYPFDDVKTIGRCDRCSNIYHRQCWDNIDHDCPKCYRLIQRKCEQDEI
jgi:run domain Beclin-1 interacting cysteine-rich containing protein